MGRVIKIAGLWDEYRITNYQRIKILEDYAFKERYTFGKNGELTLQVWIDDNDIEIYEVYDNRSGKILLITSNKQEALRLIKARLLKINIQRQNYKFLNKIKNQENKIINSKGGIIMREKFINKIKEAHARTISNEKGSSVVTKVAAILGAIVIAGLVFTFIRNRTPDVLNTLWSRFQNFMNSFTP